MRPFNDLSGKGSFWSTDFEFVNVNKLQSQYFQPLGKGVFLLPHVYSFDDFQVVYTGQKSSARYDLNEDGLTPFLSAPCSHVSALSRSVIIWNRLMPAQALMWIRNGFRAMTKRCQASSYDPASIAWTNSLSPTPEAYLNWNINSPAKN